ncbi:sulfatase [Catenovulum agarivorans DS-2]|uniref:Sulfatase n=1 Tax=Catenovulum agarivorans DS-2 TaxID=1328313 RepID=W7QJB5_9ALTE|nr:YHYH protein [Catenovulum agarivorans]EWH11976.1 sulfatase [Catenovulum agarivorans DS-2]
MKNNWLLITALTAALQLTACGGQDTKVNIDAGTSDEQPKDEETVNETQQNILLIISDDQGLDASAQYSYSTDLPNTPTLNSLANKGLTFDNAWVTPACTTTRAAIITGKHGHKSGVTYVPAPLSSAHTSIQKYLANSEASKNYVSGVFGKWHIGGGNPDANHPNDMGVNYYAGNLSNPGDYYNWTLTINGVQSQSTEYHTSKITDLAIDWISGQTNPWFAWVAYSAPHSPFHLPPANLHSRTDLTGNQDDINNNKRDYFLAAIEAMDSEIGRLINSMDEQTKANTTIIFVGDNGSPKAVIDQDYFRVSHAKGTLYQGGIAVPLIVSGAAVTRQGEREDALIEGVDLFATISELAGNTATQINDSTSFAALLSHNDAVQDAYAFSEFESDNVTGWTVRNQTHKLVQFEDSSQQLYSLTDNFNETNNLIDNPSADDQAALAQLQNYANELLGDDGSVIDITDAILTRKTANCADYVAGYTSNVTDINNNKNFVGDLTITVSGDSCIFATNAIPNHDFNDGGTSFPNDVSEQNDQFSVTASPAFATQTTALSLRIDNAILLNGVKVDLLAAGCYGIGNGKVGCNDDNQPWRYDPMHPANGFRVDSHNAHAQPDGTYHYHGSPFALFDDKGDVASPVIGFAADGFPIFGSYFDDNGIIRKALSSYQLKQGSRPSGDGNPGGNYDGAFRDDYEFVQGSGDLDECNGMTVNGVYGYYITDNYPYVLACFKGTPDQSFNK